ncbi:MAG: ribosome recycling factor [Cytophagales bacterium]|nr:ribosome recycling factor [Cytophagales bacterium]
MEEIEFLLDSAKESMDRAIKHTEVELSKLRAGKAHPDMLKGVMVEYYGAPTPLSQVASVTTPDARTFAIKPWEKQIIVDIERAIINANLGFAPQNDGETIRIHIPALTEERRKELAKQAQAKGETGKVGIRSARKDTNNELKKLQKEGTASEDAVKDAEDSVQKLTDSYSKKIDDLLKTKEAEIMSI